MGLFGFHAKSSIIAKFSAMFNFNGANFSPVTVSHVGQTAKHQTFFSAR